MLTLPDAATMHEIVQPALLITRVLSNDMFRKYIHRNFSLWCSNHLSFKKAAVIGDEYNLRISAF